MTPAISIIFISSVGLAALLLLVSFSSIAIGVTAPILEKRGKISEDLFFKLDKNLFFLCFGSIIASFIPTIVATIIVLNQVTS